MTTRNLAQSRQCSTSHMAHLWRRVKAHVMRNLSESVSRHTLCGTSLKACKGTRYVELVWRRVRVHVTWNLSEGVSRHTLRGPCLKACHYTDTSIEHFRSTRLILVKRPFRRCLSFRHHVKNKNIELSFLAIPDTWPTLNAKFEVLTAGVLEYANVRRHAVLIDI